MHEDVQLGQKHKGFQFLKFYCNLDDAENITVVVLNLWFAEFNLPLFFIQEGNMPLEELLAIYRYEASAGSSIDSSSGDLTDELPDMTLDKVNNDSYVVMLFSPLKDWASVYNECCSFSSGGNS